MFSRSHWKYGLLTLLGLTAACGASGGDQDPGITGGSDTETGGSGGMGGADTGGAVGDGGSDTGGATGVGGSDTGGAAGAGGSDMGGAAGVGGAGTGGAGTGGAAGGGGIGGIFYTDAGPDVSGIGGAGHDASLGDVGVGGSGGSAGNDSGAGGTGGQAGTGGSGGQGGTTQACDYTPTATAAQKPLKFNEITLMGVTTTPAGKTDGGRNGLIQMKFVPGTTNEFFLAQKGGNVQHMSLPDGATTATLLRSFTVTPVDRTQDCGLVSFEFDPDFATNKFVYFGHCDTSTSTKISRYTFTGTALTDRVVIMSWTRASGSNSWHTIGSIGFDADKNLWVVHGEFTGGAVAQNDSSNLGKLMKIVPSRQTGVGGFTPAVGTTAIGAWAKGLRSPWRAFMNSHGHIVIADVGPTVNEEINVVTQAGQNFGWDGTVSGPCAGSCTSPITYWHGGGNDNLYSSQGNPVTSARSGRAVWVGMEYGNCGNDRYAGSMTGVTLFGDFFTGWVRGMVLDANGKMIVDKSLGSLTVVSSWAEAPDGYLYVTTYGGPYDSASASTTTDKPALYRAVLGP